MEVKALVERLEVIDVNCDACGNSCTKGLCGPEYGGLSANWGYDSKKDGVSISKQLCEDCFDRVLDFFESISGD